MRIGGSAVPVLIFLAALVAGVLITARWLPPTGASDTSAIALRATCVLVGIAAALVGVHLYELVRELNAPNVAALGNAKPEIVATGIIDILRDVGPILGLAAAVYLLRTPYSRR
jgi:hypothetical protein